MFRNVYGLAVAGVFLANLMAVGAASAKENLLVGKRLFSSYCSLCHGDDGKGKGPLAAKLDLKKPPADLTSDKYQKMSVQSLLRLIQGYNRADSRMPKWETVIPERNLRHVAAYVLALTQTDLRMRGNARRGREIFRTTCVACHGPRGEGNGVLAKMLDVKMINYTTKAMAKVSDADIVKFITEGKGKVMPSWKNTLTSEDIKDVAAYVRNLYKK